MYFKDLLLIDSDRNFTDELGEKLFAEGYEIRKAYTTEEVFTSLSKSPVALILLDWAAPELDILAIMKRVCGIPFMVISVASTPSDDIKALLGDKYADITCFSKPVDMKRLLVALARFFQGDVSNDATILAYDDISFNCVSRELTVGGKQLELTPQEEAIMWVLMRFPERFVQSQLFVTHIRQALPRFTNFELRMSAASLIAKLQEVSSKQYISNMWKEGYMLLLRK